MESTGQPTRRGFVEQASSLMGLGALSYSRVLGANDRISLAHIGIGNRGSELAAMAPRLKDKYNFELTAVCDLWSVNRERAADKGEQNYGRRPRTFQYMDRMLELKDVDAVIISTADFQHSRHLKSVLEAGKDAYCEKPMAHDLEDGKAVRDTFVKTDRVVQIGSQHRSEPYQRATKKIIDSGALGEITKVEIVWNYNGPRWRGRPEAKQIREQDTDWKQWLLQRPYRPFDPRMYFEFRLYRDFSYGIPSQWMVHALDLMNYFFDDKYPRSVVAHGGIFAWPDGRENPDTFQAVFEYPKGFLLSYSTSFGNDCDSFSRIMGKKATLINDGGEGSPRWMLVEESGNHEDNPDIKRPQRFVTLPGSDQPGPRAISDDDLTHVENWFSCLRSRQQPNTTVHDGLAASAAVIMAGRAQREGKKLYWNAQTEEISDHPAKA